MMDIATRALRSGMASLGVNVVSRDYLDTLHKERSAYADKSDRLSAYLRFIAAAPADQAGALAVAASSAESQLGQDLFVLSELELKRGGFFVEFGATNGLNLSNSYLLEKHFSWTGIVAEPAQCWQAGLIENRHCNIEQSCVWTSSGKTLQFTEANAAEYSTISAFQGCDSHGQIRRNPKLYDVETISLSDLLDKYDAPAEIDYLSIDTEGSELDILQAFDFGKYSFRIITCEHNFTPARDNIFGLLSSNSYVRKYPKLSKWDDWFVKR